jgi:hypothetical protein
VTRAARQTNSADYFDGLALIGNSAAHLIARLAKSCAVHSCATEGGRFATGTLDENSRFLVGHVGPLIDFEGDR